MTIWIYFKHNLIVSMSYSLKWLSNAMEPGFVILLSLLRCMCFLFFIFFCTSLCKSNKLLQHFVAWWLTKPKLNIFKVANNRFYPLNMIFSVCAAESKHCTVATCVQNYLVVPVLSIQCALHAWCCSGIKKDNAYWNKQTLNMFKIYIYIYCIKEETSSPCICQEHGGLWLLLY